MARDTTRFVAAPRHTGSWLVRERAGGALTEILVPPGTLPPEPGGALDGCWRVVRHVDPATGSSEDGDEAQPLTVRGALDFVHADRDQRAWIYERSILYAGHLLVTAAEQLAFDGRRHAAVLEVLLDPALTLLDEVHAAAERTGLPDAARQTAVLALPPLALARIGISDDEAAQGVAVGRIG